MLCKTKTMVVTIFILNIILITLLPFVILKLSNYLEIPMTSDTIKCIGNCNYQITVDYNKNYALINSYNKASKIIYIFSYKENKKNHEIYMLKKNNVDDENYQYVVFNYKKETFVEYLTIDEIPKEYLSHFNKLSTFTNLYK